jgi:hypothetical protein
LNLLGEVTKKGGEIFGLDLSAGESLIVPIDEKNCPT